MFEQLINEIDSLRESINKSKLNTDITFNGNYPILSKNYAFLLLNKISDYLQSNSFSDSLKEDDPVIKNFETFLNTWDGLYIKSNNVSNTSFSCFCFYVLECKISSFIKSLSVYVSNETPEEIQKRINKVKGQCKSFESQINALSERFNNVEDYFLSIESAYDVSQKMPVTMDELKDNSRVIKNIRDNVDKTNNEISIMYEQIQSIYQDLKNKQDKASKILLSAENALGMATNASLASSFSSRKKELFIESNWWIGGLLFFLSATGCIGCWRIYSLMDFFQSPNFSYGFLFTNLILSVLVCVAPLWGAWFSTRRLGYLFKLREDYAYKAATAIAFEGYREQAAKRDENMETQVLKSVLQRFEEPPLRLMDEPVRSSPFSEILNSKVFINFLRQNPSEFEKIESEIKKENKEVEQK